MSKQTDLINIPDAITVSGSNVGIGTSTPSAKLDIQQATAGNIISAEFDNTDYTANNRNAIKIRQQVSSSGSLSTFLGNDRNTGNVFLSNDSITANHLVIDTSGNVGIGDTSPYTWSSVQPSLNLRGTSSSFPNRSGALIFKSQSGTHMTVMDFETGNDLRWYQSSNSGSSWSERMRLDSSGNLLVGKTSANSNAVGIELHSNDIIKVTRSGGATGYFNRQTSDGNILELAKDGTTVGSIGIQGTGFYIDGEAEHAGIRFGGSAVVPRHNNADSNNYINLGDSSNRFKDLYLSGGIQFDSRSNKLDDYEEGSWNPTLHGYSGGTAGGYSQQVGYYTKIGNIVIANFRLAITNKGTMTGNYTVMRGLPFNHAGSDAGTASVSRFIGTAISVSGLSMELGGGAPTSCWLTRIAGTGATSDSYLTTAEVGSTFFMQGTLTYRTT